MELYNPLDVWVGMVGWQDKKPTLNQHNGVVCDMQDKKPTTGKLSTVANLARMLLERRPDTIINEQVCGGGGDDGSVIISTSHVPSDDPSPSNAVCR